ncbi:hypothetical protein [Bacillus thuringiensis]|uniref:hypothetical protein n=1 Tax=Bacillus thuringiensis TaxID=1428 RepID=UPI0015CF602E|nr:hypothetical protein [Bacillus thuringiensis]
MYEKLTRQSNDFLSAFLYPSQYWDKGSIYDVIDMERLTSSHNYLTTMGRE